MPNALHTMLAAANIQARPVLGDLFDFGNQTGLTGFFSVADEQTAFQAGGTLDQIDHIIVVAVDQFTAGNFPTANAKLTLADGVFVIRTLKIDASAYMLGLKKVST